MLVGHGHGAVGGERDLPGEGLVQHHPQRVDVGAGVHGLPLGLLGGQVGGRAQHGGGGGEGLGGHGPGDPEVHDLHLALRREHDVGRLHVAVDDPGGVGELKGGGHLGGHLGGPLRLQAALGLQDLPQGPARDVLHDDVVHGGVRAGVVHAHHVGVVQAGRGLGLPAEPLHEPLVPGVLGGQDLDGHRPPQHGVGAPVHLGHAACPDRLFEPVPVAQFGLRGVHETVLTHPAGEPRPRKGRPTGSGRPPGRRCRHRCPNTR